jgi:hypothetical protein
MRRGGTISPLEKYSQRILTLITDQPDLTLDEMVCALHKRRIPASRSALSRFFTRHDITVKKKAYKQHGASGPTWLGRGDAGSASKGCLTPSILYLSTKLQSAPTWCDPTAGTHAANAWLIMSLWGIGKR